MFMRFRSFRHHQPKQVIEAATNTTPVNLGPRAAAASQFCTLDFVPTSWALKSRAE
jgi:hypothetical protein